MDLQWSYLSTTPIMNSAVHFPYVKPCVGKSQKRPTQRAPDWWDSGR
jgi:hypothetical protein